MGAVLREPVDGETAGTESPTVDIFGNGGSDDVGRYEGTFVAMVCAQPGVGETACTEHFDKLSAGSVEVAVSRPMGKLTDLPKR